MSSSMTRTEIPQISGLLDNFTQATPGVVHIVAVAEDGLLRGRTRHIDLGQVEAIAAVGAGVTSLLNGAAERFGAGRVLNNLTALDHGFILIMSITASAEVGTAGATLMLLIDPGADMGLVMDQAGDLIEKIGRELAPHRMHAGAGV